MSLKDWKLTSKIRTHNYYGDWYVNQKNGTTLMIFNDISGYGVKQIYNPNKFSRHFKTKSQALKFAKSYMRTH